MLRQMILHSTSLTIAVGVLLQVIAELRLDHRVLSTLECLGDRARTSPLPSARRMPHHRPGGAYSAGFFALVASW